ncbi:hypothetical protein RHOSPDRAFT_32540 [Rhodotorula sp. JG-1b]|nr:hypothetical protein RHOSPDRAFT_32540 [Rhodotorula sp. JG-1b]
MPHSTASPARSPHHSRHSSRPSTPRPRASSHAGIPQFGPDFVTVAGPASQVTLAAIIQQTYKLNYESLRGCEIGGFEDGSFEKKAIKFTGFVGITLLHSLCQLPPDLHSHLDLHNIGIPGTMAIHDDHPAEVRSAVRLPNIAALALDCDRAVFVKVHDSLRLKARRREDTEAIYNHIINGGDHTAWLHSIQDLARQVLFFFFEQFEEEMRVTEEEAEEQQQHEEHMYGAQHPHPGTRGGSGSLSDDEISGSQ